MLPARAATREPDGAREPVAEIDGRLVLAYTGPITRVPTGPEPVTVGTAPPNSTDSGIPTDRERPSALEDAAA